MKVAFVVGFSSAANPAADKNSVVMVEAARKQEGRVVEVKLDMGSV